MPPGRRRRAGGRLLVIAFAALHAVVHAQTLPLGVGDPAAASLFLQQATFGPRSEDIEALSGSTLPPPPLPPGEAYSPLPIDAWVDEQIALPGTYHYPLALQRVRQIDEDRFNDFRMEAWWEIALTADDQLRQRVAFALSQIFVISDTDSQLARRQLLMADYYDILVEHALGNYRDLLEQVTLSPAMGLFLSHLGNDKPDPVTGRRPDENYAREVMQLFSIGLWLLNPDGTPILDESGAQIPTYGQETIEGFAHMFTGWTWAQRETFGRGTRIEEEIPLGHAPPDKVQMQAFDANHSQDEKVLLDYAGALNGAPTVVAAATPEAPALAEADLAIALDNIFNHPNVAPFMAKQLIQKLVTSNPTPAYVERVAAVFDDNGDGVRGDLAAVVRAILLDDESRLGQEARPDLDGKLKEPLLRLTQLLRAFDAAPQPGFEGYDLGSTRASYGQEALRSPSVFNFFSPFYQKPGPILDAGLLSPEFQLQTESRGISIVNDLAARIARASADSIGQNEVVVDFGDEVALADDPAALISHLDLLLFGNRMSDELRQALTDAVDIVPGEPGETFLLRRVQTLVLLAVTSPEYAVQIPGWEPNP